MRRTTKAALATLLTGAGLAAALPLSAQTTQAPTGMPACHHMIGGDTGAMMKTMGEMRTMTDACRSMMQAAAAQPGEDSTQPQHNPPANSDGKD